MKVYVAGRTNMIDQVRVLQRLVTNHGHEITFDWTAVIEAIGGDSNEKNIAPTAQRANAIKDMVGVQDCDVLIMQCGPGMCGTLIEVGMALALGKKVWIIGSPERESVFFHLDNVTRMGIPQLVWHLRGGPKDD